MGAVRERNGTGDGDMVSEDVFAFHLDTKELSESEMAKHTCAENRKFLHHGEWQLSPALRARMERHTQPQLQPTHRLHKDCGKCSKCFLCIEGAPG